MPNPHRQTIASAKHMNAELAALFAVLGTAAHPRGAVLAAYATARRALAGNVDNPRILNDALSTLRRAVAQALNEALRQAADLGSQQAERQAAAYGLPKAAGTVQTIDAYKAILAALDTQIAAVTALALTTRDEAVILGDDTPTGRRGLLSPALVQRESRRWLTTLTVLALNEGMRRSVEQAGAEDEFARQAVAVIDQYTTDCCLAVDGQVRDLDQPFHLTADPHYAADMMDPPFHDNCRTTVAYIRLEDAGDELTAELREEAAAQLEEGEG